MAENDHLHHEDLAWAKSLAAGERLALDRYEREITPMIESQLRRRGFADDAIAEVQQALRARLFVGDGDGPSVAGYEGRGPLKSWVLVSALREAVRAQIRAVREPSTADDALLALCDRSEVVRPGVEKERYREAFRTAFRAALAALTPRDRVVLRMHVIDGLTVDQIGTLQGVHRATAARWIEQARESVARNVRRDLMKQLGVDPFEAEELLQWVQSRVDISLSALATE